MEIDHIHFFVDNAAAYQTWFCQQMGFERVGHWVSTHTHTEVVCSDEVLVMLSAPLNLSSPVANYLRSHPAGVADVAFRVSALEPYLERINQLNVSVLHGPQSVTTNCANIRWLTLQGWGALRHTLIAGQQWGQTFPYLRSLHRCTSNNFSSAKTASTRLSRPSLVNTIDHVVLNVEAGDLTAAVDWYQSVLGFQPKQRFDIQTNYSGLSSQVLVHPQGRVQLPINQPTSKNSQIQEFIDANRGAGVQHIALHCADLVQAVSLMRQAGVEFLTVPEEYYTQLLWRRPDRFRSCLKTDELRRIKQQQILVDWRDHAPDALLLQIFTQPIFEDPTFFFELIARRSQAEGFGEGNFRALFEAIEQEQIKRGSLLVSYE